MLPVVVAAQEPERHPMMDSTWWVFGGNFFATRDLDASASLSGVVQSREFDLDAALGLDDSVDLFMAELGWQFSENWGLALQYFQSDRSNSWTLNESVEWQNVVYDIGAQVEAATGADITRVFFARRFRDREGHSLRLGAGIHWLEVRASIEGQGSLNGQPAAFRRAVASASVPVPNVGAWYRYSTSHNWMLNARVDWFSASIDDYSGGIWNVSAGANLRLTSNFGVGLSYQFFQLDGTLREEDWRGDIKSTYTGPYLFFSGYW